MNRIESNPGLNPTLPAWKRVHPSQDIETAARMVVDAAYAVHSELGPGLLESAYEECLSHELALRSIPHRRQVPVPLFYKGVPLEAGYRADLIINDLLLVEIKSVEALLPVHTAQVITYLRLLKMPLGLLINFNEVLVKTGIHRVLNVPRSLSESQT